MHESLDEFAKLNEFDELKDQVSTIMTKASENKEDTAKAAEHRKAKIQKLMEDLSKRTGRAMTPLSVKSASTAGGQGRKAESLVPHEL